MSDKLKIMQTPINNVSKRKRNRRRNRMRNQSEQNRAPIIVNYFIEVNISESSQASE